MVGVPFNPGMAFQPTEKPQRVQFDPTGIDQLHAIKAQIPGATDMSDAQFALKLHRDRYSIYPLVDFLNAFGLERRAVLNETTDTPGYNYASEMLATPGVGEAPREAAARHGGVLTFHEPGLPENVGRAFLQGGTFGWGDEAVAAGAAALNPLIHGESGKDFDERYQAYLDLERGYIDKFREQNPIVAYGSEIAGSLPTAFAAGGQLMARGGSALGNLAINTGVNAGQGFAYGVGASNGDTATERLADGMWSAANSVAAGAALDGVTSTVKGVSNWLDGKQAIKAAPTAQQLKTQSRASTKAAKVAGVSLRPTAAAILKQDLEQLLTNGGLMQSGRLVGNYDDIGKAMRHLDELAEQPMTFSAFELLEDSFRTASKSRKRREAELAGQLLEQLDAFIDSLPQTAFEGVGDGIEAAARYKAGKQQWQAYKRTKLIEDAIYDARLSENFTDAMKDSLREILRSDKDRGRFTPEQVAQITQFVQHGGSVGKVAQQVVGSEALWKMITPPGVSASVPAAVAPHVVRSIDRSPVFQADALRASIASGAAPKAPRFDDLDLRALAPGVGNASGNYLETLITGQR